MSRPRYLTVEEMEGFLNESDGDNSDTSADTDDDLVPEDSVDDDDDLYSDDSDSDVEEETMESNDSLVGGETIDPLLVSKDGLVWQAQPFQHQSRRIRSKNGLSLRPGTTRFAQNRVSEVKDAFLLFFPPHIESIILKHSNAYAQAKYGEDFKQIDSYMLQAYFGVLILAGIHRSKNETTIDLFDCERGRPVFRAIMSKKTFEYLDRVICFDDVLSRRQSRSSDKFAPIREVFNKWSKLLPDYYNPHQSVAVDEQLLGFRGRCPFRQYMPSKPAKYGLKFWVLVCSNACYVWKIKPCLERASFCDKRQGERVVLDLVDGLKGHTLTMGKFFSSYELGQKLLSKKITMVGAMRKRRRSIPPKLLECKNRPLYQSTFAFTESTALVSYVGRKNKYTVLQSTMHNAVETGPGERKLPAIIEYYNKTKGGVDRVDRMISCYSCKRKTSRWPMVVFANMIDISALNSFIIFKEVNPNWQGTQETTIRRNFLQELGFSLAKPYMAARSNPRSASSASLLETLLEDSSPAESFKNSPASSLANPRKRSRSIPLQVKGRARCHVCYDEKSANKNNVYETICCFCAKAACKYKHNRNVCVKCIEDKLI